MVDVIIGSGPAAAGVALALTQLKARPVLVLDLGERLETRQRAIVDRLSAQDKETWLPDDIERVSEQPVGGGTAKLPQKRAYGSDYPFRNRGQLSHIDALGATNGVVVSPAYGGFSNVWGAQTMPFSRRTFRTWPISWADIEPSYKAVLNEVPLAAEDDDLAELFPLMGPASKLPPLAERSDIVLQRYVLNRKTLRRLGITVGKARLAFDGEACVRCGLCMTGCPYSYIYSSSRTFDRLRATGEVDYRSGLLAVEVGENDAGPHVMVKDASGRTERVSATRIFVACGGLGTTQLVLGSLRGAVNQVQLQESQQFVMPFLSRAATTRDPRHEENFTLNQVNILIDLNDDGVELSQIHLYPYNPAFLDALPPALRRHQGSQTTGALLSRLSAGLGYLPSWASPRISVSLRRATEGELPEITLDGGKEPSAAAAYYRSVISKLVRAGPRLDLWPVVPASYRAASAKSYHFGGSFPHGEAYKPAPWTTDRLGRLPDWPNIHLVDASVFPNVPATTFTLTVMANAHRIATEAQRGAKR